MYIKKIYGYIFDKSEDDCTTKGLMDVYTPETHQSNCWKYWRACLDSKLCAECLSKHGKIYAQTEIPEIEPPLHENCRCAILPMKAILPGKATREGTNGAIIGL